MLGDIDLTKKPQRPQLFLAKPDRTIITKLNEAYNIKLNLKLGNINELSFELPIQVDIHGELKVNPHIDLIKGRYLIKLVNGNYSEWYLITKIVDSANEDRDAKIVQCFSLAYELKDKNIRAYNVTSYNATQVLTDALSNTIWTIGYIDADFDLKYRSFDVSNTTVLDFVFQIAETFGALIMWDTNNRTINFYKPENIGINRGLTISYKKYLKAVDKEDDFDTVVTRLKVFGRDGLSIQRVNPTGTNYIEDFSYFMYPFQRDENKNVLRHSDYMSDSLCNAILDYQELVESKKGVFNDLLNQLSVAQEQLTNDQNEYYTIETQLNMVLDELDIAQTTGQPTDDLIQQRDDLTNQLNAIQDKINTDLANIQNIQNQIDDLRNILKLENNFTPEQIKELNQFVIEEVWEDENYIDDEQLYNDAIKVFEKLKIPRLTVNVDIVNFLEIIEEQRNWDKLVLGDVVTINYERLNIKVQAKIIEIDFDYENGDIKLTIANTTEVNSDLDKYLKMLYQSVSTSATVDMNKYKWNNTVATVDDVTTILNNVWDTAKRAIEGGVNNSVTIDRRGITIKDPTDPNKYVRMTNGVIGFTNDGGNTFKTVLDATGVYAERLIGKILLGNNLIISDDTGTFNISGNLLTVKDNNALVRVQLGEYDTTNKKYGLKIVNKTGTVTILDEDGILQTWQDSIVDNLDSSHPMQLKFYLPPETLSVRKCKLNISLENFRAYEKGAADYVAGRTVSLTNSMTSMATSPGAIASYIQDVGTLDATVTINSAGSHSHSIATNFPSGTHNHGVPEYSDTGQHSHSISINPAGYHTHSTVPHNHDLPQHVHSFDHQHTFDISHSHDIIYGIYESTKPSNVSVKLDGTVVKTGINSDIQDLDIPVSTNGWHTIEITSDTLGRINASLFIQAFMRV